MILQIVLCVNAHYPNTNRTISTCRSRYVCRLQNPLFKTRPHLWPLRQPYCIIKDVQGQTLSRPNTYRLFNVFAMKNRFFETKRDVNVYDGLIEVIGIDILYACSNWIKFSGYKVFSRKEPDDYRVEMSTHIFLFFFFRNNVN